MLKGIQFRIKQQNRRQIYPYLWILLSIVIDIDIDLVSKFVYVRMHNG